MTASVFPSDEALFPLLVPTPRGSLFRSAFAAKVLQSEEELGAPVQKALAEWEAHKDERHSRRALDAARLYHQHALEVLEPWMDQYLKQGVVDSYPENSIPMGSFHHRKTGRDVHDDIRFDVTVDYLRALHEQWDLNEVDLETGDGKPGLRETLHRLHLALHPIRLWKSLWRLVKCCLPLAAGWGLVWYFKLGRYMGTVNTVMADGFRDDEHTLLALGYDCLRLLGVLLVGIGILAVLYGLMMLASNLKDLRRQRGYRSAMDQLALEAHRAVRFYRLWAAHEGKELEMRHAQAVLDDYAARKGG